MGFRKQLRSVSAVLFMVLTLPLLLCPLAGASQVKRPWSVLLITVDNLRPDRMSVYSHDKNTTPYLARFAQEAAVFEKAFSTSSWTAPGIVSLVTGYYPPVHAQNGRFSFYDKKMTAALRVLAGQGYEILGEAIKGPSHQGFGFKKELGKLPDRLESFIENRINNDKPFFAWAHLRNVHLPYSPSKLQAERFGAASRTSKGIEAVRTHMVILRHPERVNVTFKHAGKITFSSEDVPVIKALYDSEVAEVDERLRRNLERMRETGLLDRTIVIISADHGEELFDHGWIGHASTSYDGKLYDELIRIPLIIRVPDQSLTGRYDALVQGVDIMPTLFDILGVDDQAMEPAMQGVSFLPVLKGDQESVRDFVYTQTTLKGWNTPKDEMKTRVASVRSATHKLIWFPTAQGTRIEGYDLRQDPDELQNIYLQNPAEFEALEEAYLHWRLDNRLVAAQLVLGAAAVRIDNIANLVFDKDGLRPAVLGWLAIQRMEETWGLEPDIFYQHEQYVEKWQTVQLLSTKMITRAMTCKAQGGTLRPSEATDILNVELWQCDL
jgi:choline-sulfatase